MPGSNGQNTMMRTITPALLILFLSLSTSACRIGNSAGVGVVAGHFADQPLSINTVTFLLPEEGRSQMHFPLYLGDTVCLLTGQITEEEVSVFKSCAGGNGVGRMSCNDGRTLALQWVLTSCQGGYGYSIGSAAPAFLFGFELTEEGARDQLMKLQDKIPVAH